MSSEPAAAAGELLVLDERGRRCPLPVIALARAARGAAAGSGLAVLSDDPAARLDVPAWCRLTGNTFVAEDAEPDGGFRLTVRVA